MKPTVTQLKQFLRPIPRGRRRSAYLWAGDTGFFRPREPYYALVSPQGNVEYNARFALGAGADRLEHGKWYTPQELADAAGGDITFLSDSPQAVEKNIKKWRFEVRP